MKKIYIVVTFTGTNLSKFIRFFTLDELAHVSISLDKELNNMYSFGRLNPNNAFIGGFVHESPKYGTFKKFEKTTITKIYEMKITDNQYKKLEEEIKYFNDNKKKYAFNRTGMILTHFHIRLKRKRRFYCAEFCKYILDNANIETNLPNIVKPEHFKYLEDARLIYYGMLRNY